MTLAYVRCTCDVCQRAMPSRYSEMRLVVTLDAGADHHEAYGRTETCSPACALTAARGRHRARLGGEDGVMTLVAVLHAFAVGLLLWGIVLIPVWWVR